MVLTTAADAGTDAPAVAQWVVFRCAGRHYGMPLHHVTEIILPQPFTRLPGAGNEVCGLVGFRGRVITVVDFGVLLASQPAGSRSDHRLLLMDVAGRRIGAAVDDVIDIAPADVRRDNADAAAAPAPASAVLGSGRSGETVFTALDAAALVSGLLQ